MSSPTVNDIEVSKNGDVYRCVLDDIEYEVTMEYKDSGRRVSTTVKHPSGKSVTRRNGAAYPSKLFKTLELAVMMKQSALATGAQ